MIFSPALWRNVTNLADSAVLLPLCLMLLLFLWWGQARQAWLFLRAFLLLALALTLLKLLLVACGTVWHAGLNSPSGHVGLGIFAYGSLCTLVVQALRPRWRWLAWLVTLVLLLGVACSRLLLGAHTAQEVMVGALVGLCGWLLFYLPYRRVRHPHLPLAALLALVALTVVLSFGLISPAEKVLGGWADWLRHSGLLCHP